MAVKCIMVLIAQIGLKKASSNLGRTLLNMMMENHELIERTLLPSMRIFLNKEIGKNNEGRQTDLVHCNIVRTDQLCFLPQDVDTVNGDYYTW
jgi:hypothetical protein